MALYRLYFLDCHQHFVDVQDIEAKINGDALAVARGLAEKRQNGNGGWELWQGAVMVLSEKRPDQDAGTRTAAQGG